MEKGYTKSNSLVKSVTHFSPVARTWKQEDNKRVIDEIRMVYDATKSGLNDAVWDPWFATTTVESHLRYVEADTFVCDHSVG